jgi:hypothetical protein
MILSLTLGPILGGTAADFAMPPFADNVWH